MLQEDYRVRLEAFQGPLDLLLYLIRRAEVDVTDIPVAQIADQYLAFLRQLDEVDVDVAGEFLVMAATLIELKSRTLMPPEAQAAGEGAAEGALGGAAIDPADPRHDLVQQLLAYQRFRIAADALESRRREFESRFPRRPARTAPTSPAGAEPDDAEVEIEIESVHLLDLAEAYERIASSIDFTRLGEHVVEIDDTPIELHQEDLLDRLRSAAQGRLTLQDAFSGRPLGQRVGLFLATLELARTRRITVKQDEMDAPIEIVLLEEHAAGATS
jgi:segregation and condensation protein A